MDDIKYNHKLFYITSGILLILLSIICFLNMEVVARGVGIIFYYPFGFGAYFIFAFLIVQGFSLIIRSKWYRPNFILGLGLTLSIVGMLLIYSTAVNFDGEPLQAINLYNSRLFESTEENYFLSKEYFNIFDNQLAGGFLGYLYYFLVANWLNNALTLTIAIIIASVGVIILAVKPTIKLVQFIRVKVRNMPPREKKPKKQKPESMDEFDSYVGTNIYAQARQVGRDEVSVNRQVSELKPVSFDNREEPTPSIEFKQNIRETGVIIKPMFSLGDEVKEEKREIFPEPKEEILQEVVAPLSQPVIEPVKEEHHEQMNLDFDAPRELNQELLGKQPEMAPLEEIPSPVQPTPIVTPKVEPQVASPEVKRKPIKWIPPSSELLSTYATQEAIATNTAVAEERKELINKVFEDFNISASCTGFTIGPSITRFHIHYESTGLVKNVQNLVQDISRRLSGVPVRFEATVPGYDYSGLEVPNGVVTIVSFR